MGRQVGERATGEPAGHPPPRPPDDPHAATIGRALAIMRETRERPLPLPELAGAVGLSPFHFSRLFRQVTGAPPGQFAAALRLERAKTLLLTTDLPVTEICYTVGYTGLGTFTSRFARGVGLPPGELRRLPDLLGEALARSPLTFGRDDGEGDGAAPRGVLGTLGAGGDADALTFVGLFPGAIPQGHPVVGTALAAPGPFRLAAPPDGTYQLLAAAVPHPRDPAAALLPGAALRVGRSAGSVVVRGGRATLAAPLHLRPPLPTDPPVLVALPALLLAFCPQLRGVRDRERARSEKPL